MTTLTPALAATLLSALDVLDVMEYPRVPHWEFKERCVHLAWNGYKCLHCRRAYLEAVVQGDM